MSKFSTNLHRKFESGYQAFSLASREPRRVVMELRSFGAAHGIPVAAWDCVNGLETVYPADMEEAEQVGLKSSFKALAEQVVENSFRGDPAGILDAASGVLKDGKASKLPESVLLVLHDFHNQFQSNHQLRTRFSALWRNNLFCSGGHGGHIRPLLFVTPSPGLHADIDHLVEPLVLDLLTPEEIKEQCLDYIQGSLPPGASGLEGDAGDCLGTALSKTSAGLYHHQILDVLSMTALVGDEDALRSAGITDTAELRRRRRMGFHPGSVELVAKYRRHLIEASGLVRVHSGKESFSDVAGLDALKVYLKKLLVRRDRAKAAPKGILLVGVPGCGKSLTAKALGTETGMQTLLGDLGSLMSSDLGGTEHNVSRLLDLVDSSGPSILFLDEVEKMLSGVESSGKTDGGTISRAIGKIMTWSADRGPDSEAFLFATANSLKDLPSAFYRAGRFNAVFYAGMPSRKARDAMWTMYLARYGLSEQPRPQDDDWTGAEIANCCEQAYLLGCPLIEAVNYVTKTRSMNAAEMIELEETAEKSGFIDAEFGGPFSRKRREAFDRSESTALGGSKPKPRRLGGPPNLN